MHFFLVARYAPSSRLFDPVRAGTADREQHSLERRQRQLSWQSPHFCGTQSNPGIVLIPLYLLQSHHVVPWSNNRSGLLGSPGWRRSAQAFAFGQRQSSTLPDQFAYPNLIAPGLSCGSGEPIFVVWTQGASLIDEADTQSATRTNAFSTRRCRANSFA